MHYVRKLTFLPHDAIYASTAYAMAL